MVSGVANPYTVRTNCGYPPPARGEIKIASENGHLQKLFSYLYTLSIGSYFNHWKLNRHLINLLKQAKHASYKTLSKLFYTML